MPDERPLTEVAVGLVFDRAGRVLLGQRPQGKPYAGWWEFPGGKLEPGESVAAALARELHEELGIHVRSSRPWIVREHSYPHARVRLHFRRVFDWDGEPVSREGQAFGWTRPDAIGRAPLLPATVPILAMLALPGRVVGISLDRLADRSGHGGSRADGSAGTRSTPVAPRVLLVADRLEDDPGRRAAGAECPGALERRLRRLRAVPGAIVCAGEGLAPDLATARALGLDGLVLPPDRLSARTEGTGLLGLRIDDIQQLELLSKVGADFAVVVADVSGHLRAFGEALALTAMPVYLAAGGGLGPGSRPAGLQGIATGRWRRA